MVQKGGAILNRANPYPVNAIGGIAYEQGKTATPAPFLCKSGDERGRDVLGDQGATWGRRVAGVGAGRTYAIFLSACHLP